MKNPIKTVFFDLDGTLVDHFAAILRCINWARNDLGVEPLSRESYGPFVGATLRQMAEATLDGGASVDRFCDLYLKHIDDTFEDGLVELPGARWILRELAEKGYAIAIFTNKRRPVAEKICQKFGFLKYASAVVATESDGGAMRKPHWQFSASALRAVGAHGYNSAMVGDSETDFLAAQSGNFAHCFLVTTGMRNVDELMEAGSAAADIFPDLPTLGAIAFSL
ncbi:MAG: HAD family hydrolase [Puniceicoccales bacterium]|nr:HAD family hydrolase [Puniceicoccales bacterium]